MYNECNVVEWSGESVVWCGVVRCRAVRGGRCGVLEGSGWEWIGVEWSSGVEWSGGEWSSVVEWSGVEWSGVV